MPPPRIKRPAESAANKAKPKIFLVHGQNEAIREMVARFIEKLGCEAIILHEQPNQGKTIFQKFHDHSAVEFAVVLLTGDDRGGRIDISFDGQSKRARQNVILEMGFFLGKLGAQNVCCLYEDGVELPSDYDGMLYVSLHTDWKAGLVRELKSAGIKINSV
ncbi:MAG TPA: nucleotide-binding protein [Candidatus Acidoferrum sp.]|jgi:predicted nucleotide-binding protein|nr:nucleotide-binding protein [Candidatus Acidoferrum sp.]